MSRIRGIEAKVLKIHKDYKDSLLNLETRKNKSNKSSKKKNESSLSYKNDVEKLQINELLYKLPKLDAIFDVHRKIGEGTFSSVYLGSLKQHSGLSDAQKPWFAIKHLVPTAHPARIEHELRCLQDMGGKHNVIGVELCLRHLDTIVFVMPYIPHKKFSEYVGDMDAEEVRQYMRALMVALRHVHSFGVIHRDVKPSNFLYDRENKRYLLVDFGLAQRVWTREEPPAALPPPAHSATVPCKRPRDEDDSIPNAKRMALDLSVRAKCNNVSASAPKRPVLPKVQIPRQIITKNPPPAHAGERCPCACANVGGVCGACATRVAARAPRAGTQGFRPPEVLLKSPRQGTAVDTWAAGVVLASLLTARYPFFRAGDDVSALAELADLLGTEPLQRTAEALGRRVVTSAQWRGLCLRKLAERLRGPARVAVPTPGPTCRHCRLPSPQCLCRDESKPADAFDAAATVAGFPDAAFALLARLLDADPRSRLSAAAALAHPFLAPSS
ncbi:cell division cycle 7-related protein kinase-like [Vanessa tameamea]|uniref:non-specific serine/threonine protein kinase n=1 Tax=Vanessa tameamea TaxID=334116 RepID=A0A8B8IYG1_VANTA